MSYVVEAPFVLPIGDDAGLMVRTPAIARAYHNLLVANQERLSRWEPWACAPLSLADTTGFLTASARRWAEGHELPLAIVVRSANGWELVGSCGLWLDDSRSAASIGYWIDAWYEGRGLVTRSARALLHQAFGPYRLARVEISTVAENVRSRAVAQRLGFTYEGVRRQAIAFPTGRCDQAIFGMLADEWTPAAASAAPAFSAAGAR
ncbi:GNAT family protein [Luedemannella helvata]|uniref:GNAT family protein n=1 Tax=Luedemannella helvata TaxID=349315 RepID=A0ABN2KIC5_9ACTN